MANGKYNEWQEVASGNTTSGKKWQVVIQQMARCDKLVCDLLNFP